MSQIHPFVRWIGAGLAVQGALLAVALAAAVPSRASESIVILEGTAVYKGKPVENAVVYIDGLKAPVKDTSSVVSVNQKRLKFIPHVMPVQAGTRVAFKNSDSELHNIHAYDEKNKTLFNVAVLPDLASPARVYDKPGEILLKCDVHPEMSAYLLVLPNSYYAITDKKGRFKIAAAAPAAGPYTVKFWHEEFKAPDQIISYKEPPVPIQVEFKR
ncbi:hypothetical protein HY522_03265 [bacterium]|nr:hypothetical protein [bacterium]